MTTPIRRRSATTLLASVCLMAVLVFTGCSQDRHVYRSTAIAPKSVSLVSVESGNTLWTKNIPVGEQLLLDFSRKNKGGEEYSSPEIPADKVTWETWSLDAIAQYGSKMKGGKKIDSGKVDLPGQEIIIKVDILDPEVANAG
ncbi:MAG: hypothetical protein AAGH99_03860 [Planctomycetota bacterium]